MLVLLLLFFNVWALVGCLWPSWTVCPVVNPHNNYKLQFGFAGGKVWTIAVGGIVALSGAPVCLWLVAVGGATVHLKECTALALLTWASLVYQVWMDHLDCHLVLANHALREWLITVPVLGIHLALVRLASLEKGAQRRYGARQGWCAIVVFLVLMVFGWLLHPLVTTFATFAAVLLLVAGLMVTTVTVGFLRALCSARRAAMVAPAGWQAEAVLTARAMCTEVLCLCLLLVSSASSALLNAHHYFLVIWPFLPQGDDFHADGAHAVKKVVNFVDACCNLWFALQLSGAATGGAKGAAQRLAAERRRRRCWTGAQKEWEQHCGARPGDEVHAAWWAKVQELSGRGVTLEALLSFYKELPHYMPHFDPELSTTDDVVRAAIIPQSAAQRCAYAEVLMQGKVTFPGSMVTHCWSNRFRDLVAAVLADALGERDFLQLAVLLDSDLPRVEMWARDTGAMGRSYWICAFAVNQHAGICNIVRPGKVDSVTRLPPHPCRCGLPKQYNDSEPQLPDGRSILCEMNKFDDMMRSLSARDRAFQQVVAIDKDFELFSRAWCVAELAAASKAGMLQCLKIISAEALELRKDMPCNLRIEDMRASRPEDIAAILAAIPDKAAFNERLQHLLFHDLFPAWASLDAQMKMAQAGQLIRWLPVWECQKPAHKESREHGAVSV